MSHLKDLTFSGAIPRKFSGRRGFHSYLILALPYPRRFMRQHGLDESRVLNL